MEKEITSFWTDIKKFEDTLARDPNSYSFAPLAELYRKSGLLDEAINTARQGVQRHPDYVGGYMALGRACFDKGEKDESRLALEKVISLTPDNLLAHKLLSQLYLDAGDNSAAAGSLRTILSLNPVDLEAKVALDALQHARSSVIAVESEVALEIPPAPETDFTFEVEPAGPEQAVAEGELVEELTEYVEDEEEVFAQYAFPDDELEDAGEQSMESAAPPFPPTATLAELFISQGFLKRAMKIYHDMLVANPDNLDLKGRMVELKQRIDEDNATARRDALKIATKEAAEERRAEPTPVAAELPVALSSEALSSQEAAVPDYNPPPPLVVLENWLANIRRNRNVLS